MERKYFIRTKDFYEIVLCENYVKIITGEYSRIGRNEKIDNEEIEYFESYELQKKYFDEKINYVKKCGYVLCERATDIPNMKDLSDEECNDIYEYFFDEDSEEFEDFNYFNYFDVQDKHICLLGWPSMTMMKSNNLEIEYFIKNKEKYKNTEYFTFGNVDYEICEISWITQSDYTEFFKAFPNIKGIFIQGMNELKLGVMDLPNLETLEIQGSGLTNEILEDISKSNLPNLKRLNLYFGVEDYGLDITVENVKNFLANSNLPNIEILGFCNINGYMFSEILESVFDSKYAKQIKVLDMSLSGSTEKDAKYIIDNIKKLENIKYIDLNYNYIFGDIRNRLLDFMNKLDICIDINNENNDSTKYYSCEDRCFHRCCEDDLIKLCQEKENLYPMYTE